MGKKKEEEERPISNLSMNLVGLLKCWNKFVENMADSWFYILCLFYEEHSLQKKGNNIKKNHLI